MSIYFPIFNVPPSPPEQALPYLRAYRRYCSHWPVTFRPLGTGLINTLLTIALCQTTPFPIPHNLSISNPSTHTSSADNADAYSSAPTTAATSETGHHSINTSRAQWYRECRAIAEDYQKVLGAATQFPRAGERNVDVENFVDLVMGVWERGGCVEGETEWIIEVCLMPESASLFRC